LQWWKQSTSSYSWLLVRCHRIFQKFNFFLLISLILFLFCSFSTKNASIIIVVCFGTLIITIMKRKWRNYWIDITCQSKWQWLISTPLWKHFFLRKLVIVILQIFWGVLYNVSSDSYIQSFLYFVCTLSGRLRHWDIFDLIFLKSL
jgi:hypothetical protein